MYKTINSVYSLLKKRFSTSTSDESTLTISDLKSLLYGVKKGNIPKTPYLYAGTDSVVILTTASGSDTRTLSPAYRREDLQYLCDILIPLPKGCKSVTMIHHYSGLYLTMGPYTLTQTTKTDGSGFPWTAANSLLTLDVSSYSGGIGSGVYLSTNGRYGSTSSNVVIPDAALDTSTWDATWTFIY